MTTMTIKTTCGDFIHTSEVCARYGIGLTTMYRWVKKGILPRPVRIGNRAMMPRDLLKKTDEFFKKQAASTMRI